MGRVSGFIDGNGTVCWTVGLVNFFGVQERRGKGRRGREIVKMGNFLLRGKGKGRGDGECTRYY